MSFFMSFVEFLFLFLSENKLVNFVLVKNINLKKIKKIKLKRY